MEVTIEKLVYGGDGLARLEAEDGRRKTVFVPLVLPDERVAVTVVDERPGFSRAKLDRVVTPAPERTSPPCPYFGECGGCHYQHASYEAQLEFKKTILRETVERLAKVELPEITSHASPPLHYRNRTRMKFGRAANETKFELGYYRMGSHVFLPVKECPISSPLINHAVQALWAMSATHELPVGLTEIEFFGDDQDAALFVEFLTAPGCDEKALREFAKQLRASVPQIAGIAALSQSRVTAEESVAAPELDSTTSGKPLMLAGSSSLPYRVGDFSYRVSAGSFFQANRFLTSKLLEVATANASGKLAVDLYAGVGLFTVRLAQNFERLTAVEASPASFRDLIANAPANVKPIESTTEDFFARFKGQKPDFVLVDPPRGGLGKRVVNGLTKLGPKRIAYVSCDPSTLARDLSGLTSAGYRIEQADLLDLFPQTFHLETLLRLAR